MVQCRRMTHRDTRCKREVSSKNGILYPRGARLPFYCPDHLAVGLENPTFRCLKYRDRAIDYDAYVPFDLEDRTQVLLRERMRKPPSAGDEAGFIYGLQIEDINNPDLVHIKVGRTNAMNRRMAEHLHKCPSGRPLLLGYYPRPHGAAQAELSLARIKPGVKVPFADMLEELVHLELADIASNALPSGAVKPGERRGVNRRRRPCVDCGRTHEEIFTFRRLPGAQRGREWEVLVLPVIEAWGAYVSTLVARAT
ncbi:hypothetical protein LXA43DRAFT_882957 [Ganoderma leucocontextum]|nr:hypothetical protein LXA43DRAFT_882957 [Ganoderma leucocontextum]